MSRVVELIRQAGVLWQHEAEFAAFCEWMIEWKITSVLEIGTGFGGSAFVFGEILNHARVVSVDFDILVPAEKKRSQPNPNFVQIHGNSRCPVVEALVALHAPFDLVFFDTEHPYEECEENFHRYAKFATRFIAQHDINADEQHWPDMGIPCHWRDVTQGKPVTAFIDPDIDLRFPRWGGIGVVSACA